MPKYLAKFSRDWCDEFHAEGLAIYTEDDRARLDELITSGNLDWYFGTNEGFEGGELELSDFAFTEISDEEILFLERLIPDLKVEAYSGQRGTFGQIPSSDYLEEAILNTTE